MKMKISQLSQIVDHHLTKSETSSTYLISEIIARLAESHIKTDSCHEKAKAATKRVEYIVELLNKEEQKKRKIIMKMIELRQKKMGDKAREREEKKKIEDDKKGLKVEKKRK